LLALMVDRIVAAGAIGADRRDPLIAKLTERERLSSTGIGGHVGIPHASGENIGDMIVAVGVLPDGVAFDAIDGEPVRLVFLIVGSERAPRIHLQLLAAIVRFCKNRQVAEKLMAADDPADAYAVIVGAGR